MDLQPTTNDRVDPRRSMDEPSALVWLIAGLFTIALLCFLRVAASLFLPLAIAFFLAVSIFPLSRAIRNRVPPALGWLGYLAAAGVVIAFLLLFFVGVGIAAQQIAANAGQIVPPLQQRMAELPFAEGLRNSLPQLLERVRSIAASLVGGLGSMLGTFVVIFFLMLLMLLEAGDWRKKVDAVTSPEIGKEWQSISSSVGQKFRTYVLTRIVLGSITGALYAAWLALFGVPLLLVWAILALLLNFVPTIGSLIAGLIPVVFVIALQDAQTALIVGVGILAIEQIMGNYIDPKITGRQMSISPLAVLSSLLLWTWVWGIAGALIATPMTMMVVIVFSHFTALRPIALLLSGESDFKGLDRAARPSL